MIGLFCSCGNNSSQNGFRIGVDPLWYPEDFGPQNSYINGYTEDLLLEMAQYSGARFELVRASWDNLLDGLKNNQYDAVITTLPPHEYNTAKYDFSDNLLDLGPVLITPNGSKKTDLDKLKGDLVGIIANDPAVLLLEKYPSVIIRNYHSIPELLNGVVQGEIQAAVLNQIPAVNYIGDLYAGVLQIEGKPMTGQGIHLVGPKGRLKALNQTFEALRKKKKVDALLKKWELAL
ncbi:MAG: transporter substrate-binding domain-containing protein [Chlamydiales bacterium]